MFQNIPLFNLNLPHRTRTKPQYNKILLTEGNTTVDSIPLSLPHPKLSLNVPQTPTSQTNTTFLFEDSSTEYTLTEPSTPMSLNKNFKMQWKENINQIISNLTSTKNSDLINQVQEFITELTSKNGIGMSLLNNNNHNMNIGYILACFGFIIVYLIENEKINDNSFFIDNNFITSETIKMIHTIKKVLDYIITYTTNKPNILTNNNIAIIFTKQLNDAVIKVLNLTFKQTDINLYNELIHHIHSACSININKLSDIFISIKTTYHEREKKIIKDIPLQKVPQFLIPFPQTKPYTLVLDLDETLVHVSIKSSYCTFRPGLKAFLDNVSRLYELILFTTSTQDYADNILSYIEKDKCYFSYKLYRQHSTVNGIKNLSLLGRDLARVVIVDDKTMSFAYHKENGILIKPFICSDNGRLDRNDFVLYDLSRILCRIFKDNPKDIRESLKKYKKEIDSKISF